MPISTVTTRRRRWLHPAGRSFRGELEVWGLPEPLGSALIDQPARHPATIRISTGAGTRGSFPDVLGLAFRVDGHGDILLSTTGTGRLTRHLPAPRRSFDTTFGSIVFYRTGTGTRIYLTATAAGDDFLLDAGGEPFARLRPGAELSPEADACLAFDPVRDHPRDLRPAALNTVRAITYRLIRQWRGARA